MAVINKTRVGEALCGVGHELAHVDLLIGPRGSSAEMAFANCLTNNKHGFTSLLSVVAPNLAARPHAVMFNKVTIRNGRQAVQMFGPAQRGVAMAIADAVHEGVIPLSEADHVFIAVGVFIHWLAEDDARIQDFNYEATKLAIRRAVNGDPKILEVLRQKELQEHPLADHK